MKLVYVTGFPRSGTTYTQRLLASARSCTTANEEQGIDHIWTVVNELKRQGLHFNDVTDELIATTRHTDGQDHLSNAFDVYWMGIYVWKNVNALGVSLFDAMCSCACDGDFSTFVVKTPSMRPDHRWIREYVRQSSIFTDHRTVVLMRHPETAHHSGVKLYKHWSRGVMSTERYLDLWMTYYSTILDRKDDRVIVIPLRYLHQQTLETTRALESWIGLTEIEAPQFRTGTEEFPTWLKKEQRQQVDAQLRQASRRFESWMGRNVRGCHRRSSPERR